jgi:hypothetical protein
MYKKLKRGGLTPGLKNYVKKEDSQEKMIAVVDKKDGLEKFVKKSEVMKDPSKYFPSKSNYEAALQIAKTKEPGSRLSVSDIERAMQSVQGKIKGGMSKIDKLRSTKGQFTIGGRLQTLKDKMKKTFGKKSGGLTGGQKKLDKNKNNRIDAQDFKILKAEKAKGRGMGLQDEKVKPGKVMKAGMGAIMLAKKMGGGMMQRPMGYKHGTKPGAGPLGAAGLRQPAKENIDQIIKDQKFPPISIYIEDKKKQKPFPVPSLYNNNKKPSAGKIRKVEPRPKKMGEPKRYKSGTMVKASEGIMALKKTKGGGADMGTEMSDKRKKKFKQILARLKNPTTINIKSDYESGTKSPMQRDRKREGYRAKVESLGGKVLFADEMSKGGGADTGRIGEIKSKLALAKDKFKRIEGSGARPSEKDLKRIIDLMKSREPKQMQPLAKKMGGGMMQKYQTGGSVMARGCKLGRKKATKLY